MKVPASAKPLSYKERGAAAVEMAMLLALVCLVATVALKNIGATLGGSNIETATQAFNGQPLEINGSTDNSGPSAGNGAGGSSGVFGSAAAEVSGTGLSGGIEGDPEVGGYWNTHNAGSSIGNWDVVSGSVDARVTHSNAFNHNVEGHFLDLNGSGYGGHIRRNVPVIAGQSYNLSMDLGENAYGGPPTKSIEVIWNGEVVSVLEVDLPRHELRTYTVELPPSVDGNGVLEFKSLQDGSYGVLLDNPTLTLLPS